ncbi:MAG: hypothetical protein ACXIUV_07010 [Alkalilacustris sp.]
MRRLSEVMKGLGAMGYLETWERWRDGETGMPVRGVFRVITVVHAFHERSTAFERVETIARWPMYLPVSNLIDHLDRQGAEQLGRAVEFFNEMDLDARDEVHRLILHMEEPTNDILF